jgi:hypothetical protein
MDDHLKRKNGQATELPRHVQLDHPMHGNAPDRRIFARLADSMA